jgi:hypothetical protein
VRLLLQCSLYTRDFEDWDQKLSTKKIWTNLKTFVQKCYTCQLNASSITAGSQGYVQNASVALTETSDDNDNDVQTVMMQMAALTTQSQITAYTVAKTSASVAAGIKQLASNQQTMQQKFPTFTMQCNTTYQQAQVVQPPMTQFSIPNFASFPT